MNCTKEEIEDFIRAFYEKKEILFKAGWIYEDDKGWIPPYGSRKYPAWDAFDEYVRIKAEELGWTTITTAHHSIIIEEEGGERWVRYQHPVSKKIYNWDDMFYLVMNNNNDDSNYEGTRISQFINKNVDYKSLGKDNVIHTKQEGDNEGNIVWKILKIE